MKSIRYLILLVAFGVQMVYAQQETKVKLITNKGTIILKLYDETPTHRDNFKKLVSGGFYDSTLFHRVIKDFMIQGGDPESKNAKPGKQLGNGGPGYTLPAEFVPGIFHKRGALAAARLGDKENPEKRSSGSQFYIVQGKKFTESELKILETRINKRIQKKLYQQVINSSEMAEVRKQLVEAQKNQDEETMNKIVSEKIQPVVMKKWEAEKFEFSPEQIEAYTTIGGAPHLDGSYTVFGEVIEGMEVVDEIASQPTDKYDRPIKDVMIIKAKIIEE
ncbi:MAG: peptidylprolyl isomerase [Bacteroidetes bacterium]|nr:MAG: peptidylprolyl isomerase [Bacteroidota bacterium]